MAEITKQFDTLYKDAVDNLRFLKTHQWLATNYAALAQAAIFAVTGKAGPNYRALLVTASIIVAILSIYSIWLAENSMAKFRLRLNYIYQRYFDEMEREELKLDAQATYFFPAMLSLVCLFACCVNLFLTW